MIIRMTLAVMALAMAMPSATANAQVAKYAICFGKPGAYYFYGYCGSPGKCDTSKYYYSDILSHGLNENIADKRNAFEAILRTKPGGNFLSVAHGGCFDTTAGAKTYGLDTLLAKYPNNERIAF